MAEAFEALDTLCAVSMNMNRLDKKKNFVGNNGDPDFRSCAPSKSSFVNKLLEMLCDGEIDPHPTGCLGSVRWGKEGRTIVITDHQIFAQTTLPRYFKHK